jgi:hypothetical protein
MAGASNCSGTCSPGYACALGSTNGTAAACPAGRYSVAGAGVCTGCPAGRFGTLSAQSMLAVACPGLCGLGFFCPPGSTSPTAMPCPPGTYTDTFESSRCTLCPAGTPYSGAGATSAGSCLACGPGVVVVAAPNTTRTAGCDSGLVAAFPCPDPDWFPWVSSAGVEPAHSCLRLVQGPGNWSAANATCSALAPGARLLTTQQVAAHSRMDCSLSLLWSCGLVVLWSCVLRLPAAAWVRMRRLPKAAVGWRAKLCNVSHVAVHTRYCPPLVLAGVAFQPTSRFRGCTWTA